VRKADSPPPSCVDVKKSGGPNLLEPCGPVQAYNGTDLPFFTFVFDILEVEFGSRRMDIMMNEKLVITSVSDGWVFLEQTVQSDTNTWRS
jgi:hypothetical protein